MTSEDRVKLCYPNSEALFQQAYKWWGVFLDGRPHIISCGPRGTIMSDPYVYGNSRSNAWVNARKKMDQEETK